MTKKLIALLLISLALAVTATAYQPIDQQAEAHAIATQARINGLPEDCDIIRAADAAWWRAQELVAWDRDLIAAAIYNEAWGGCTERHRELVGAVVLNRMHSPVWPNSIYEVLAAPGQYAINPTSKLWWQGKCNPAAWQECQRIAMRVLRGEVECPAGVVYQSNGVQGRVYATFRTSYSTTYFCYGRSRGDLI